MLQQIKQQIEAILPTVIVYYDEAHMMNCIADSSSRDSYYIYIDEYHNGKYSQRRGTVRTDTLAMYIFKATDGRGNAQQRDNIYDYIESEILIPIMRLFGGSADGCSFGVSVPRFDIFEVGMEVRISIETEVCL